jgi:uncharacterized Fe-S center protein
MVAGTGNYQRKYIIMKEKDRTELDRREFLKALGVGVGAAAICSVGCAHGANDETIPEPDPNPTPGNGEKSLVYMTQSITSAGLIAAYKATGSEVEGRVAVKISTGEPGGHHFLSPDLIRDLVQSVNGTIVECNTAYGGRRSSTASHKQAAAAHGFTAIADVDIMDEQGAISLPVTGGRRLTENFVGSHFANYDSFLVLSHFKGHAMAGFGGALKNISIGIASTEGKCLIHTGGRSRTSPWGGEQTAFLESMAEASQAVISRLNGKILYVNLMNNLSIDCDCDSSPAAPELDDIGILASTDPVALDKACVDLIYAADAQRSASLRRRIESQRGTVVLTHAESLGLGNQQYEIVNIDSGTGIEATVQDGYQVYPNPASDYVQVSGDFEQLTLLNAKGATIAVTVEKTVSIKSLPAGIYFLKIKGKNRQETVRKIIKK